MHQLPRYRIVEDKEGGLHAEFLVLVSLGGGPTGTITFGIWRRHSDFAKLATMVHSADNLLIWCIVFM